MIPVSGIATREFFGKYFTRTASIKFGLDAQARTFSVLSHLAAMLFVQLAHALSLNDFCDWLRLKRKAIAGYGITPPARKTLAYANKSRDAKFVEVQQKHIRHFDRLFPATLHQGGVSDARPGVCVRGEGQKPGFPWRGELDVVTAKLHETGFPIFRHGGYATTVVS